MDDRSAMSVNERPYITCRQLIEFIGDYISGELDDFSRGELERHLERCASCRAYLASYQETMTLVRAVAADDAPADDVPEELVATILRSAAHRIR
jgi:anti-sigma factor RsiW